MPALNADPQRPHHDPPYRDTVESWAMPLGKIAGIQFQLSYSVFVAFAVLAGMIAMVRGRLGNEDLPMVALIGSGFWAVGWLIQLATYCFYRFVGRLPIQSMTIGLLGVESRSRTWSAGSAFLVTSTTILSMITFGTLLIVGESLMLGPRSLQSALSVWTAPGFGLLSKDTVWLAGAWLCWIQAICQMFPLPKSIGRVWVVSSVSLLSSREVGPESQLVIARRVLQIIATATAIIAIASIGGEPGLVIPRWPLLLMLAVILWITSSASDIGEMLMAFHSTTVVSKAPLISRTGQSVRSIWLRRRARRTLQQEHTEAADADRLDSVLQQLHEHGIESLSSSDRALLDRVSQTLRRQREIDSKESSEDPDGSVESI